VDEEKETTMSEVKMYIPTIVIPSVPLSGGGRSTAITHSAPLAAVRAGARRRDELGVVEERASGL
jgi:hypothetical protein